MMGFSMPSRDLIVRAVTPAGSFGKVFGFVSTGMNLAWAVAPIVFGQLMDRGHPQAVFMVIAASCALAVLTVLLQNAGQQVFLTPPPDKGAAGTATTVIAGSRRRTAAGERR